MSNFSELVTSDTMGEFYKAMAKFQETVKQPKKDEDNPYYGSKYVPLDNIVEVVNKCGPKVGLSYVQFPVSPNEKGEPGVVTRVGHSSGEYMQFPALHLPTDKRTAQGIGSAITYARRYSLASAYGLASDTDDDANATTEKGQKQQETPAQQYTKNKQSQNRSNGTQGAKNQNNGYSQNKGNNQPPRDEHTQPFPDEQPKPTETDPKRLPMTTGQETRLSVICSAIAKKQGIPKDEVYPRFQHLYKNGQGKVVFPAPEKLSKYLADKVIEKLDEHSKSKNKEADLPPLPNKGENGHGEQTEKGGDPKQ